MELLTTRPHWVCFIISGIFLFAGIYNYQSSGKVKDYIETVGEVRNVEEIFVYRHHQKVARYNFEVVWYIDGEEYVKLFEEQVESRKEGETTIWVSADNNKVTFSDSLNIAEEVPKDIAISLVSFVAGCIILYVRKKGHRRKENE